MTIQTQADKDASVIDEVAKLEFNKFQTWDDFLPYRVVGTGKQVIKTDGHLMHFADNPTELGFPTCISTKGLRYNPVCGGAIWAWNKLQSQEGNS